MRKALYKPVGFALGTVVGLIAGTLAKRVWRAVTGSESVPEPTDEERDWREIIAAAALQGAVFAAVRAAVDRGGAASVRRLTGRWPTSPGDLT